MPYCVVCGHGCHCGKDCDTERLVTGATGGSLWWPCGCEKCKHKKDS